MVLGFMQKFPWGEPTYFKEKILEERILEKSSSNGLIKKYFIPKPKIHTIRAGQRWKPGMKLHMAYGVRSKFYFQFNAAYDVPELQTVKSVQRIDILHRGPDTATVWIDRNLKYSIMKYHSTHKEILQDAEETLQVKEFGREWFEQFLQNDGLTEEQFWKFFKKPLRNGQLIHWTDLKY